MLICVVTLTAALAAAAAAFFAFAAAVAASFASLHDIAVVARRNAAAAGVVAAIPAVHGTHGTHEAPCVTVASGRVDSYYGVVLAPALESDCGLDLAVEVAVGQYGHRLPRQVKTGLTMMSHKSSTM